MSDAAITPQVPEQDETVTAEGIPATEHERRSRKQRAIERALQPLQAEVERLKAELARRPAPAEAAPQAEVSPKPKRADFASDEAFEDGLIAWSMQKTLSEKAATDAQAAERAYFEGNVKKYAAQIEEARKRYPDWEETVNQEIHIGHQSQLAIMELDNSAEVLYWLGKNPDRAAELGRLKPVAQITAVGRLSEYLRLAASGDEPEYRRPSGPRPRIPAPVRTVNTGSGPSHSASFADVANRPNYPGKARDLKRIAAEQR